MDKDIIRKRLYYTRRKLKMTQADVAAALGFSQGVISRIEKGKRQVDIEMLEAFAKLYSVKLEFLLGLDNEDNDTSNYIKVNENIEPIVREIINFSDNELSKLTFAIKIIKSERLLTGGHKKN